MFPFDLPPPPANIRKPKADVFKGIKREPSEEKG